MKPLLFNLSFFLLAFFFARWQNRVTGLIVIILLLGWTLIALRGQLFVLQSIVILGGFTLGRITAKQKGTINDQGREIDEQKIQLKRQESTISEQNSEIRLLKDIIKDQSIEFKLAVDRLAPQIEFIHDSAHFKELTLAITNAERLLIISTGWISDYVVDKIEKSLIAALKRRVEVVIIYGWADFRGEHILKPEAEKAIARIKRINAQFGSEDHIRLCKFENHSKVLICDDKYVIVGSNNWLTNTKFRNKEISCKILSKEISKQQELELKKLLT